MKDADELTDLLHTAAEAGPGELRADPGTLISRARAKMRRRQWVVGLCTVAALALAGVTATQLLLDHDRSKVDVAAGDPLADLQPGWSRLPEPPLSPRSGATAVSMGEKVVVVGGRECPFPLTDNCNKPLEDLADGAAFDLGTRTWQRIAPSPVPFYDARSAAVVGGDVFLFTTCDRPSCPETAMLRYRAAEDAWDVLPAPPGGHDFSVVVAVRDGVVAFGGGERRRLSRFDLESATWTELPGDPLHGELIAPEILVDGGDLLLFGEVAGLGDTAPRTTVGARLDIDTGRWVALAAGAGASVLPAVLDGQVVLLPHTAGVGGIFDLNSGSWRPLPGLPAAALPGPSPPPPFRDGTAWRADFIGAVGQTKSVYRGAAGWVLDMAGDTWLEVPPVDERRADVTTTAVGRRLFTFGGSRWPGDHNAELGNDAWIWTPPPGRAASPQAGTPEAVTPSVEMSTTTILSAAAPLPAPPSTLGPGAPQFLSATGDAATGRVTVRFDRPVVGDPVDKSPGSKTYPPGLATPMNLIVFGADKTCSVPQGNGHDYLSGMGTDTITTDATSLAAGTTYIAIGQGFVKSAADGTLNAGVVREGLPRTGMFPLSCIPIQVSGAPPSEQQGSRP